MANPGPASTKLSRSFWVFLLLLPILWIAIQATQFRTRLEIASNSNGVRLNLDGQSLEVPVDLGGLRLITLKAGRSFFPISFETLVLKPETGGQKKLSVPTHLTESPSSRLMTGDWWADRGCDPVIVFEEPVVVDGAFVLSGVSHGRSLEAIEIILTGPDQSCRMYYRGGHLSNDFGFALTDGTIVAQSRTGNPARDWLHLSHHLFGALFWGLLWVVVLQLVQRFGPAVQLPRFTWDRLIPVLLTAGFVTSLWVAVSILDKRPHFQDDLGYLLRAKWLLNGHLKLPVPPNAEHFAIPFTAFTENGWISQYTLGWPLLLAAGEAVGQPWLIAPLCGLILGFLTWKLGVEAGGKAVGFVAAMLGFASPLGQLLAGSMLAHTATAMCLALFTWMYIIGWREIGSSKGLFKLFISGLALGLAFTMRPLSAVAFALPAAFYGLSEMRRSRFSRVTWRYLAAVVAGGLMSTSLQLIDNHYVTGDFLKFAYKVVGDPGWSYANYFSGTYLSEPVFALAPAMALGWGWPFLALSNWLPMAGIGLALVVFLYQCATKIDWFLLGICFSLSLLYMGYQGTGLHGFGPRYLADIFFALFILIARGLQVISQGRHKFKLGRLLAGSLVCICVAGTLCTLPLRLSYYKGYNESDDRIERTLVEAGITRGLILLSGPDHIMWARCGRLLSFNDEPSLVFALFKEDNRTLIESHPGMPIYVVSDEGIRPYTKEPLQP
jgi:hypothetical protein